MGSIGVDDASESITVTEAVSSSDED